MAYDWRQHLATPEALRFDSETSAQKFALASASIDLRCWREGSTIRCADALTADVFDEACDLAGRLHIARPTR